MLRLPLQVSFLSREIGNVRLRNFVYVVATRRNIEETWTSCEIPVQGITSLPVHSSKIIIGRNDKAAAQRSILPSGISPCWMPDGIGAFISNFRDRSVFIELFQLFSHHIQCLYRYQQSLSLPLLFPDIVLRLRHKTSDDQEQTPRFRLAVTGV